jgi:hypothetical protein
MYNYHNCGHYPLYTLLFKKHDVSENGLSPLSVTTFSDGPNRRR